MAHYKERILVIKLGAFGDLVQADGVLRDIRAFHKNAEIVLLTTPAFVKMMQRCPHVDRVISDSRAPFWRMGEWIRLARIFKNEHFSKVYDLQNQDRTRLYHKLFFRNIKWSGRSDAKRSASAWVEFVEQLESERIPATHTLSPDLSWMADEMNPFLNAEGVRRPYVALIPGCSHPQRRWPYFSELARLLIDKGYDVVTAPGPDEIELAKTIPGHTLLGPNGFLNRFELAGVLKEACFIVGNDTGPSHVAAYLDKPGLVLFGPETRAARSGMCRGHFHAIETEDLSRLSVTSVIEDVFPRLPALQENSV